MARALAGAGARVALAGRDEGRLAEAVHVESAGTGYTTLTVTNVTQQQIGSAAIHQLPSFTSVQVGTTFCCSSGTSQNITPIPSFTAVKFSALKFDGALLSALSPAESEMYDHTVLQVATSAISSTGGFTNTFKHV